MGAGDGDLAAFGRLRGERIFCARRQLGIRVIGGIREICG
jgi:hypothetical protein